MITEQKQMTMNADQIRNQFAIFLNSLPQTQQKQSGVELNSNGKEQLSSMSTIRQILNRKRDASDFELSQSSSFVNIKQNVFHFEEVLRITQQEVKTLKTENMQLLSKLTAEEKDKEFLKSQNDQMKSDFESILTNLNEELSAKTIEIGTLMDKLKTGNQQIKTLTERLSEAEEKAVLQESNIKSSHKNEENEKNYETLIQKFQKEITQYQVEVSRLKLDKEPSQNLVSEVNYHKLENDRLKRSIDKNNKELRDEKTRVDEKTTEIKLIRDNMLVLTKELEAAKVEKTEKGNLLDLLNREITNLKSENGQLKSANTEQLKKSQSMNNEAELFKKTLEELSKTKNEAKDLLEKFALEKTNSAKLSSDLAIKAKDLEYVQESIQARVNEIKSKQQRIESLETENTKKSEQVAALETKIMDAKADFDAKFRELTKALEKEKQETKKMNQVSELKVQQNPAQNSLTNDLKLQIEQLMKEKEQSEEARNVLEESNEELMNKLNEYQTHIENLEVEIQKSDNKVIEVEEDSKRKIQEFINVFNENNPQKIHDLNVDHVNELSQENQNLKEQMNELAMYTKDLETKLESLENEKQEMNDEIENMKEYIESFDKMNVVHSSEQLKEEIEKNEEMTSTITELEIIIVRLNKELEDARNQETLFTEELTKNQTVIQKLQQDKNQLTAEIQNIQVKSTQTNSQKTQQLESEIDLLNKEISSYKLQISKKENAERIVQAEADRNLQTVKSRDEQLTLEIESHRKLKSEYNQLTEKIANMVSKNIFDETEKKLKLDLERLEIAYNDRTNELVKLQQQKDSWTRESNEFKTKLAEKQQLLDSQKQSANEISPRLQELQRLADQLPAKDNLIQQLKSENEKLAKQEVEMSKKTANDSALIRHSEDLVNYLTNEIKKLCKAILKNQNVDEQSKHLNFAALSKTSLPENYIQDLYKQINKVFAELENKVNCLEKELEQVKTSLQESEEMIETINVQKYQSVFTEKNQSAIKIESAEMRVSDMVVNDISNQQPNTQKDNAIAEKDALIEDLNQQVMLLNTKFQEVSSEFFEKSKAIMEPIKEDIDLGEEVSKIEQLFDEILQTYEDEVSQDEFKYVITSLKLALDDFMTKAHTVLESKPGDSDEIKINGQSINKEELVNKFTEMEEQLQAMESEFQARDERIKELESDLDNVVSAYEESKEECGFVKEAHDRLEAQVNSKKPQKLIDAENDFKAQINKVRQENKDLGRRIRDLEKENKAFQTELISKEQQIETIQKDVEKAFEETTDEFNAKIEEKDREIEELHQQLGGKKVSRKDTGESNQDDVAELMAENESMKEYIQEITQLKEDLEGQLEERDIKISELTDILEQIKSKNVKPKADVGKMTFGSRK